MEFAKIIENIGFYRDRLGYEEPQLSNVNTEEIVKVAYEGYKKKDCEYGVITSLSDTLGLSVSFEDILSLKKELPHGWNHLCGAVTGSFVILSLTLSESHIPEAVKKITDFHNLTDLPIFKPDNGLFVPSAPAGSILCRDSIINWSKKTGIPVKSRIRSERCAGITVDMALNTLSLLSHYFKEEVKSIS